MSKIICDVCGTAYAETATQCPICGSVRPGEVATVGTDSAEEKTYTYVKGGRFSKANVRKRNKERMASGQYEPVEDAYEEDGEEKSNTGLIIVVVALTLAIIAAVIYIFVQFFGVPGKADSTVPIDTQGIVQTQDTTEDTQLAVPCEDLVISKTKLEFDKKDVSYLLNVRTTPEDTTDEVTFASSDENVVTVSSSGKITAVGGGEAVITVTCGNKVTRCEVICTFESEGTEPSETTEPTTTVDENAKIELNREDFTLTVKGSSHKLYNGEIPADQITWTTDDEKVATIKDGVVTAKGRGWTTVYGEYGSQKVSCIVRCADSVGTYEPEVETEPDTDNDNETTEANYTISHTDVTLIVGNAERESFTLTLKDKDGATVNVVWTSSDEGICTVNGNLITGLTSGSVVVSTEIDGQTYKCTVIVH